MSTNQIKVITPDNLGKGITYNPQTKQWEASSGFDCASFEALPVKPWKKGTHILAKQEGECVRLTSLDSIFQEIGVGITANRNSAFVNESYNVVVTVTNTGESKNELSNLVVQKPLLGDYEIKDVRTSKDGVDEVETLNELSYNLKGLTKGGTFILRFTVVAKAAGTFQFTANVNSNTDLDLDSKNNTATIILTASTKEDVTYITSVDCPRITATELDSNTVLSMLAPDSANAINAYTCYMNNWNIFAEREDLKGLRIRLDGASTVVVYLSRGNGYTSKVVELSNERLVYADKLDYPLSVRFDSAQASNNGYTYRDGVVEFTVSASYAVILCRPAGKNCKWQAIALVGSSSTEQSKFTATDVVNAKISYKTFYGANNSHPQAQFNVIPPSVTYTNNSSLIVHSLVSKAHVISKMIVRVKSGEAASLTLNKSNSNVYAPIASGNTTITENRVEISANATSTDSINSDYLQVIVED